MRTPWYWRAGLALVLVLSASGRGALGAEPGDNQEAIRVAVRAAANSAMMRDSAGTAVRAWSLRKPRAAATAGSTALSSATIGLSQEGVPCFGCLPGFTIGLPVPLAFVTAGSSVSSVVTFHDTGDAVACTAYAIVVQNKQVLYFGKATIEGGCQTDYVYWASFNTVLSGATGPATLVGILAAGSNTSILATPFAIE